MHPFILEGLALSHPDGTVVLSGITASLSGKIGVVGRNGSGKSTLLRCLAGHMKPSSGSLRRPEGVAYLPQNPNADGHDSLGAVMGIADTLAALRAIEAGSTDPRDFARAEGNWDLPERALATLESVGLGGIAGSVKVLERPVSTLSGGEVMAAALAGAFLRSRACLLLDEPTNNLDTNARRWLFGMMEAWRGCMVVASHDAELLQRMNSIAQIRNGGLAFYRCPYTRYLAIKSEEKVAADRRVSEATATMREEQRRFAADQARVAGSRRQGVRAGQRSRFPTAALHLRRGRAEKSAATRRSAREQRITSAREILREAKAGARPEDGILVELPETSMPAGTTALHLESHGRDFLVQGPERIALAGRNGSGKSTLLRTLLGQASLPGLVVRRIVPEVGLLAQNLEFAEELNAIEFLLRKAPALSINEGHAVLARFLLRNHRAMQPVATLSGGERLRLALAALLSVRPAPRLMLLDEPTNNLDRESLTILAGAMIRYRGAIIAVSHDQAFLQAIGTVRTWTMEDLRLRE